MLVKYNCLKGKIKLNYNNIIEISMRLLWKIDNLYYL